LLTKPRKNYCFLSFCSITNAIVVATPTFFNVSFSATTIVTSIDIFDYKIRNHPLTINNDAKVLDVWRLVEGKWENDLF
jgi:hypothetical protein